MANKVMTIQTWLKKDEVLKKQFLLERIQSQVDITLFPNHEEKRYFISDASQFNSSPEQQAVIE
ncbi:hypothetical protein HUN22_17125, partial [Acinetobacter lactucae]|nr:hypothetical protein [Acinetobacter lactucae]